jgi:hypothetical protein
MKEALSLHHEVTTPTKDTKVPYGSACFVTIVALRAFVKN